MKASDDVAKGYYEIKQGNHDCGNDSAKTLGYRTGNLLPSGNHLLQYLFRICHDFREPLPKVMYRFLLGMCGVDMGRAADLCGFDIIH